MLNFFKKTVFALLVIAAVLFGIQPENLAALSETIQFHLKLWDLWHLYSTPPLPVALLFGVCFLLGILVAGLHGVYERFSKRREVRKRDRRIRELEAEVDRLRAQAAELKAPATPAGSEPQAPDEVPEPPSSAPQARLSAPSPAGDGEKKKAPPLEEEPTL